MKKEDIPMFLGCPVCNCTMTRIEVCEDTSEHIKEAYTCSCQDDEHEKLDFVVYIYWFKTIGETG